jgi:hypothetical protein
MQVAQNDRKLIEQTWREAMTTACLQHPHLRLRHRCGRGLRRHGTHHGRDVGGYSRTRPPPI